MKIRFVDTRLQREEYIIPLSLILYLNEKYENRDISCKILHYFLCYLSDVKNNKFLEAYKTDLNEIKIALNGLSNNNIEYNQQINDYIVNNFCEFVKDKEININILVENIEEFEEYPDSIEKYDSFCLLKQKQIEEEQKIFYIEVVDDPVNNEQFVEEVEAKIIDNNKSKEDNNLLFREIFSKYFGKSEHTINEKYIPTSPDYEWNQTSLRFKKPDGTWGKWVDLKGSTGKSGGGSKGMNREQVNELITYALDPLSASTVRSHIQSASYFSMSSGSINTLSASRISVYDLVVQNSNLTGSGGGGIVSASIVRTHELSASYFEFISGNVQRLTASYFTATQINVHQISASYNNFPKIIQIQVTDPNGAALIAGDGQAYLTIPIEMNGNNLINAQASAITGSSSGTPTIQIRNVTAAVDMLSTKITIDVGDNPATSYTAATPSVIDIANDDVQTGDILAVDIDVKGTGVKGLMVILTFQSP